MAVDVNKTSRRMQVAVIFFVLGISMMFYGILDLVIEDKSQVDLTDNQIRARAKELGMVEVKEAFKNAINNSENSLEEPLELNQNEKPEEK